MYEDKKTVQLPHHIILDGRERLSITGVEDVESFDENAVVMSTSQGVLMIKGTGLRVDRLSLEGGELNIEGTVDSLQYEDTQPAQGGFLSRLFR